MRSDPQKTATKIRSSLLWEATKRHCRVQKSRSVIMDNNEEEEEEAEEEEAIGPYGHRQADVQQLRVFVGTWNVGGLKPPPDYLQTEEQPWDMMNEWINQNTNQAEKADLYVIGFQEIVPLNATNILLGANLREGEDSAAQGVLNSAARQWDTLIGSTLNTHNHNQIQIQIQSPNPNPNPNPNPDLNHTYESQITSSSSKYDHILSGSNDLNPSLISRSRSRSRFRRSLTAPPSPITHHNHDSYEEVLFSLQLEPEPESESRMRNAGRPRHEPRRPPNPGPECETECHPSALASHGPYELSHHITPDTPTNVSPLHMYRGGSGEHTTDPSSYEHHPPRPRHGRCDTTGARNVNADSTDIDKMYMCPGVQRRVVSQADQTYDPRPRAQNSRREVITGSRIGGASTRVDENMKKYIKVVNKQMVGLFVSVWAREDLCGHIKGVEVSCVGCGIMGYLGNKGAVSVSLTIGETSMCFICSHLNSGDKPTDVLRRNADVTQILRRTRFRRSHRMKRSTSLIDSSNPDAITWCKYYNNYLPHSILGHDRIIWFGDLNYRLSLPLEDLKSLVSKEDWEALLAKDELKHEKGIGGVFEGWHEGPILFAPTYKYVPNTDTYYMLHAPTHERVKRRAPAWCDRILWYGKGLKQMSYTRSELRHSDHRPVASVFLAEIEVLKKPSISEIFKKHQYPQFTNLIPCITKVQVDDIISPIFKQQESPTRGDGHVITLNIMS